NAARGLTFDRSGTGFTYDGSHALTGGTVNSINILDLSGNNLFTSNGWNFSAAAFSSALQTYAGNNNLTSGLDGIFASVSYSVVGGGGTDVLVGGTQADYFFGQSGNDTFFGGSGSIGDYFDGGSTGSGAGSDTVDYSKSSAGLIANLATPASNTGDASGDTYFSIENLRGSDFNDTLTGDGNNNILEGGLGTNTLVGGGGSDTASYAHASAGVTVSLAALGAQNTVGAGTDTLTNISNVLG